MGRDIMSMERVVKLCAGMELPRPKMLDVSPFWQTSQAVIPEYGSPSG